MENNEYGFGIYILGFLILALSVSVFVLAIFLIYGGSLETMHHGVTFKGIAEIVFGTVLILADGGGVSTSKGRK